MRIRPGRFGHHVVTQEKGRIAMLQMTKIEIEPLREAYEGVPA